MTRRCRLPRREYSPTASTSSSTTRSGNVPATIDGVGEDFRCALCKEVFLKARPDSEAMEECKEIFGDVQPGDCEQVCDDCWEKIRPDRIY